MSLNNDVTRCTGEMHTPSVAWVTACPVRDKCRRYTDKPPESAAWVSQMNAPRISKRGCKLMIKRLPTTSPLTRANSAK